MKSQIPKRVLVDEWILSLCRVSGRLDVEVENVPVRDRPFANALAKVLATYLNHTR